MTETTPAKPRAERGSSTPVERVHRAYAALRGLAADVYEAQNPDLEATYGPALDATRALQAAFEKEVTAPK